MRAVLQRVAAAKVTVNGQTTGEIGPGLLIYLGVHVSDTPADSVLLAGKAANLRIFADACGLQNLSLLQAGGQVLVVSNFTLYADTARGRRPSYFESARPEAARVLYERFMEDLRAAGANNVQAGVFGAMMQVYAQNDGPINIILDTKVWMS